LVYAELGLELEDWCLVVCLISISVLL